MNNIVLLDHRVAKRFVAWWHCYEAQRLYKQLVGQVQMRKEGRRRVDKIAQQETPPVGVVMV